MYDDSIEPTDSDTTMPQPVKPSGESPPKPVTSRWVFSLLRIVLVGLLTALVTAGIIFLRLISGWVGGWKLTLIIICGLLSLMSVLVIVGGALDIRKLFHRLREAKTTPAECRSDAQRCLAVFAIVQIGVDHPPRQVQQWIATRSKHDGFPLGSDADHRTAVERRQDARSDE